MKYSNYIGVLTAIGLIASCFLPWVYIEAIKTIITGIHAENTSFGRPGLLHIIFSGLSIIFFLVPAIWAKRTNLFLGAFNVAWSLRNYLIITQCELGECPVKKIGIYAIIVLSVLLLVMTMLPNLEVKE